MNKEEVKQLMDQAALTPVWAAGSAATLYLLTDYAIRTNRLQTGRPGLLKFGTVLMGAISGIQLSLFRLRLKLKEIDPEGQLQREAKEIFVAVQQGGKGEETTKSEIKETPKPEFNKYGDRVDEFK